MSFYNDLKKPYTPPKTQQPKPLISIENELQIARQIAGRFKQECLEARKKGCHSQRTFYSWITAYEHNYHFSTSDYNTGRRDWYVPVSDTETFGNYCPFKELAWINYSEGDAARFQSSNVMTYEQCHRIYLLVRSLLSTDGFPSDTVSICKKEIRNLNRLFNSTVGALYCLLLETSW